MAQGEQNNKGGYGKSYGKRPMWQWIVLYVVVGGIVYYLAYLMFFSGQAGGGYHY